MEDLLKRDASLIWHPFTPEPHLGPKTAWVRAEGAYVYDARGRRYFDATSSWWCQIHGHCHPRIVEAIRRQAGVMDQVMFAPHTHALAVELASKLLQHLGTPFSKVFYSDDGSTAVETALKMALQYFEQTGQPRRRRFVSLDRGYHGDTLGAVSVSGHEEYHGKFESLLSTRRATAPYCYRCPLDLRFPECEVACLHSLEAWLDEKGTEVAAVIVEPLVLAAGGMISYPQAYLERLVEMSRRRGALVIFDEVFTGFGRTGTFFALDKVTENLKPDLVCLSKGLTSGVIPLAATVVKEEIWQAFRGGPGRTFYHGHTFTANPLGCAVALESLKIFEEENVLEKNKALSAIMEEASEEFREMAHVGNVRHLGMIWAIEMVRDKKSRECFDPPNGPLWNIATALWDQGVWMRPLNQMLYLVPPYCTRPEELREVFSLLSTAVKKECQDA
jgi:adenosylmethionine---8-amino-7-oxononanoate aminotransferase